MGGIYANYAAIADSLTMAGFGVGLAPDGTIADVDPADSANRIASGAGALPEISSALRTAFLPGGVSNAADRNDISKRTHTFYARFDAIASAVGLEAAYSPVNFRDGSWNC